MAHSFDPACGRTLLDHGCGAFGPLERLDFPCRYRARDRVSGRGKTAPSARTERG